MKRKTLLLTGASGFFGSQIKKKLNERYKVLSPSSIKLNLLNKKSILKYFENNKIDIIINSAWRINSTLDTKKRREDNYKKNIDMSKNLIFMSKKFSIKFFLNISSINVYKPQKHKLFERNLIRSKQNQASNPEGKAKIYFINQFSNFTNKKNLYKNLLFSNIYGFNKNTKNPLLIDKIYHNLYLKKNHKIFIPAKNKIIIDYIYIKDAVSAVNFFLKKLINKKFNHQFINIGSGRGYNIDEIVSLIDKKKNIKKFYFNNKNKKNLISSIDLAKKYGWKPKYSLHQGIKEINQKYINIKLKT